MQILYNFNRQFKLACLLFFLFETQITAAVLEYKIDNKH